MTFDLAYMSTGPMPALGDGVEAWIDQYMPVPPEGRPRWMQQQISLSTFVILVCTPTFRRRFEGTESPGIGHGGDMGGVDCHTGALRQWRA